MTEDTLDKANSIKEKIKESREKRNILQSLIGKINEHSWIIIGTYSNCELRYNIKGNTQIGQNKIHEILSNLLDEVERKLKLEEEEIALL